MSPVGRVGLFYFFIFMGLGALVPYLGLLLSARGFDATEVGLAMALLPLADVVAPPLWGLAADGWGAREKLLRVAAFGTVLGAALLWLASSFAGTLVAVALFCLARAPVTPLADATARAALGASGTGFAHVRLWGTLGFALSVVGLGLLGGSAHPEQMVGVMVAGGAAAGLAAMGLPAPPLARHPGVTAAARRELADPAFALLLVGCAVYYIAHGAYDAFVGLHVVALGHSQAVVGIGWGIAAGAEVLLMAAGPYLLRRWSASAMLLAVCVTAAARWLFLGHAVSAAAFLATQPLHAVSFGLWYLCMVELVQSRAKDELRSTLQSLFVVALSVGRTVGFVLGGRIFETRGGGALFEAAAAMTLLALPLYWLAQRPELARRPALSSRQ